MINKLSVLFRTRAMMVCQIEIYSLVDHVKKVLLLEICSFTEFYIPAIDKEKMGFNKTEIFLIPVLVFTVIIFAVVCFAYVNRFIMEHRRYFPMVFCRRQRWLKHFRNIFLTSYITKYFWRGYFCNKIRCTCSHESLSPSMTFEPSHHPSQ